MSRPIFIHRPSPHFSSRKGSEVHCTIIHYTGGESAESTIRWFQDLRSGVSSHFVIARDGRIFKCVDLDKAAWHAGRSKSPWGKRVNRHSIGIELANKGEEEPYTEAQLVALEQLLAWLKSIGYDAADNLLGHNEIAPDRKIDPGKHFPWDRFRDAPPTGNPE